MINFKLSSDPEGTKNIRPQTKNCTFRQLSW